MDTSTAFTALALIFQGIMYGVLAMVAYRIVKHVRATHARAARYAPHALPYNSGHIVTRAHRRNR